MSISFSWTFDNAKSKMKTQFGTVVPKQFKKQDKDFS